MLLNIVTPDQNGQLAVLSCPVLTWRHSWDVPMNLARTLDALLACAQQGDAIKLDDFPLEVYQSFLEHLCPRPELATIFKVQWVHRGAGSVRRTGADECLSFLSEHTQDLLWFTAEKVWLKFDAPKALRNQEFWPFFLKKEKLVTNKKSYVHPVHALTPSIHFKK